MLSRECDLCHDRIIGAYWVVAMSATLAPRESFYDATLDRFQWNEATKRELCKRCAGKVLEVLQAEDLEAKSA